jgi:hypothetical protein
MIEKLVISAGLEEAHPIGAIARRLLRVAIVYLLLAMILSFLVAILDRVMSPSIIPLSGFLAAAALAGFAIRARADINRIKALPHKDLARSLDFLLARYGTDLIRITPEERYNLVLQEMRLRALKQIAAMCLAVVMACSGLTLVYFYQRPHASVDPVGDLELLGSGLVLAFLSYQLPHTAADPADRSADLLVIEHMKEILSLRGEFENRRTGWSKVVRQEGLKLADLISSVDPGELHPARTIIQHEYKGWALLMVARTFGEESPERDAKEHRIEYAERAIQEFDAALELMRDIELRFKAGQGDQGTEQLYSWITGESADIYRSHYLKAVALAVIARAGGRYTKEDVLEELGKIPPGYLSSYPPDNNPDLRWAQH